MVAGPPRWPHLSWTLTPRRHHLTPPHRHRAPSAALPAPTPAAAPPPLRLVPASRPATPRHPSGRRPTCRFAISKLCSSCVLPPPVGEPCSRPCICSACGCRGSAGRSPPASQQHSQTGTTTRFDRAAGTHSPDRPWAGRRHTRRHPSPGTHPAQPCPQDRRRRRHHPCQQDTSCLALPPPAQAPSSPHRPTSGPPAAPLAGWPTPPPATRPLSCPPAI